ncbi:MAG: hypothetical protein AAF914_08300 [Pseudomonadota bacterium]
MAKLTKWAVFMRAFLLSLIALQPGRIAAQSSAEVAAWAEAVSANTIDSFHRYLSEYPAGEFVGEAVTALRQLGAFGTAPTRQVQLPAAPAAPAAPAEPAGVPELPGSIEIYP